MRSEQRNRSNGKDEPLCLLIIPDDISEIKSNFNCSGEQFKFPISFYFNITPRLVPDEACPNYGRDENGVYVIDANKGKIKLERLKDNIAKAKQQKSNEPEKRRYF